MFNRILSAIIIAAALVSCGGGDSPPPDAVTFAVRLRGLGATEEFRVATTSPTLIAQARAQLALPEAERRKFIAGPIHAGNGGHNLGWSWHFSDFALADATIELCDGRPSMVEANLAYWLNTVKSFCPWSSYIHAEIQ